jgi:hypothetical protein
MVYIHIFKDFTLETFPACIANMWPRPKRYFNSFLLLP